MYKYYFVNFSKIIIDTKLKFSGCTSFLTGYWMYITYQADTFETYYTKKHHNLCNIFLKIFLIFFFENFFYIFLKIFLIFFWKIFLYFFENFLNIFLKIFLIFFLKVFLKIFFMIFLKIIFMIFLKIFFMTFWKYFSWFFEKLDMKVGQWSFCKNST